MYKFIFFSNFVFVKLKLIIMRLLFSFVLGFLFLGANAQFINKGDIKIQSGTTLYVNGLDINNDNGTTHTWSNDGSLIFKGDNFTNNGTMDAAATGTTEFSGANQQTINGTSVAYFHNLNINNANNSVLQQSFVDTDNMTVSDGLQDFDYKVATDKSLTVNDVLTTNGDVRLMGTSQLVQTHTGATSNSGSNFIWIDQQGTTNQYYFNYWSAPVNQGGNWKMMYLRDGAEGDDLQKSKYPQIQIVDNANATSDLPAQSAHPVSLNAYWVYAFKNALDNSYQGWYDNHIRQNGTVVPGEGYTMKGPGVDQNLNPANGDSTTDYNSWTFAGLANDGDYSLTIDPGNDYLIGNPYPSALDADQFIKDNVSAANNGNNANDIFNGNLYFWEHTGGNDHYGANYQGGYATYNLTGGTAATSWNGGGTVGTKTPQQYIPVGQGFFVWAETSNDGGNIIFKNSQRVYEKEGANSVFIRPVALTNIRIGLNTPQNYHRQLLLGVRDNTTDGIDVAWDGPNFDTDYPGAEMSWLIDGRKFVIQAVPSISTDSRLPLKVEASADDTVEFTLDAVENLPADITNLYIYDSFDDTYHQISDSDTFEIFLNAGTYDDRFELVFEDRSPNNAEELQLQNISAYFNTNTKEIVIKNSKQQLINKARLFALTGQQILSEKLDTDAAEIRIPAQITTGVYLLKVISADKVYTTKILIK